MVPAHNGNPWPSSRVGDTQTRSAQGAGQAPEPARGAVHSMTACVPAAVGSGRTHGPGGQGAAF